MATHEKKRKLRLLFLLPILVVLGFSGLVAHECKGAMEAWRRADCSANPKQFGLVCKMFAMGNEKHLYPPLSSKPGKLMLEKESVFSVFPEYLTNPWIFACPSVPIDRKLREHPEALIDDQCFFYLGYVVTGEADVAGFCAAYKDHIAKGIAFDDDFKAPAGQGNLEGDIIYRLREGIDLVFAAGLGNPATASFWQSKIPVLIERPENHMFDGGNVLFLDGHVEFLRYPGTWPMTEKTINALKVLDAMGK
jgi:prepilin-type processing-associated H-X9-DG protein